MLYLDEKYEADNTLTESECRAIIRSLHAGMTDPTDPVTDMYQSGGHAVRYAYQWYSKDVRFGVGLSLALEAKAMKLRGRE